jgi:hypothetical protein
LLGKFIKRFVGAFRFQDSIAFGFKDTSAQNENCPVVIYD